LHRTGKDGRTISLSTIRRSEPMKLPTEVANEIARLMRDPDALRHERERLPGFGRRGHYDPNQPRVSAGHPDGGQWTRAGGGAGVHSVRSSEEIAKAIARLMRDPDALRHTDATGTASDLGSTPLDLRDGERPQLAQFSPNLPPVRPGHPIVMLLTLFAALSARNTPDRRAIFEFNAREFLRDPTSERAQPNVHVLNREEVENVCRKLEDVQRRTDRISDAVEMENRRTGLPMSRSQIGSAVHVRLKKEIDSLGNPNYRAEVSYWKAQEDQRYGKKDSIRIDVLENVGDGLVCVYDVKTGLGRRSGLEPGRMKEIAEHVLKAYPHVRRIVITEVRPSR
jgi:hypothetical protein